MRFRKTQKKGHLKRILYQCFTVSRFEKKLLHLHPLPKLLMLTLGIHLHRMAFILIIVSLLIVHDLRTN